MAFSICLKVTVVDKKVLAHCTNLKKRTIIVFVIMFIMLLIFSVLMFLFHIIPGITFLVLDLFILLIICLYRKLPNEVFLYNPEKEELILYGKGSLFTFSKPLIINRNDVISLGFNGKSPLNKRYFKNAIIQSSAGFSTVIKGKENKRKKRGCLAPQWSCKRQPQWP